MTSRGIELDRHTIVVNRAHRSSRDGSCRGMRPAGIQYSASDIYEIPVHPAGFPLLMALAVAPMQPRAREVEPDVGFILMLIAWLGSRGDLLRRAPGRDGPRVGDARGLDTVRGKSMAGVFARVLRGDRPSD